VFEGSPRREELSKHTVTDARFLQHCTGIGYFGGDKGARLVRPHRFSM
jgi:hypothetical protein